MIYNFVLIGSYSIAIAVVIALFRIRKVHRSYHPFLCIIFAAFLNEISSSLLIHLKISNVVAINVLGIVEAFLWLWQFKRWKIFRHRRAIYSILAAVFLTVWVTENIIFGRLFLFSSVYAILYSFIMVFLSIGIVNKQIVEETRNLLTNPKFLICTGGIIFYTYRILVECFYLLQLEGSQMFLTKIFLILAFVNLFVNLLFALATLWIPTRQRFTLPYL